MVTFSQLCTVRPHTARYAVVATWVICRNAVPPLSLAFRGAQPGHTPSGLLMALTPPSRQKIHWLIGTGQFIVNCHATIHAGLLNLLSPDTFSEDKMVKNASSSGTRLGAYKLQRPPDSLAGLRGREGKGKRGEGTRGEKGRGGKGGKREGRSARGRVASQFQLLDPLAAVVIVGAGRPPDIDRR